MDKDNEAIEKQKETINNLNANIAKLNRKNNEINTQLDKIKEINSQLKNENDKYQKDNLKLQNEKDLADMKYIQIEIQNKELKKNQNDMDEDKAKYIIKEEE